MGEEDGTIPFKRLSDLYWGDNDCLRAKLAKTNAALDAALDVKRYALAKIDRLHAELAASDKIAGDYYKLLREASDKNVALRKRVATLEGLVSQGITIEHELRKRVAELVELP